MKNLSRLQLKLQDLGHMCVCSKREEIIKFLWVLASKNESKGIESVWNLFSRNF